MCLKQAQEHKHSFNKGREIKNHSLKSVNFIFLEWNSGISSFGLSINLSCLFGANIFDSALMFEP